MQNSPTVLIIADDTGFARDLSGRWQMERNAPAITVVTTELFHSAVDVDCDLVIIGRVRQGRLTNLLKGMDSGKRAVISSAARNAGNATATCSSVLRRPPVDARRNRSCSSGPNRRAARPVGGATRHAAWRSLRTAPANLFAGAVPSLPRLQSPVQAGWTAYVTSAPLLCQGESGICGEYLNFRLYDTIAP